jgi:hypothetical protein
MKVAFELTAKHSRVIWRCLQDLFSPRGVEAMTWPRVRGLKFPEMFTRRVKVDVEGRELLLTDTGASAVARLEDILCDVSQSSTLWTKQDVGVAVREAYEACWKSRQEPETSDEFVSLVARSIDKSFRVHTFIAALRGVKLEAVASMKLGEITLVASVRSLVENEGLANLASLERPVAKDLVRFPCLTGRHAGTYESSKRWFIEQAHLAAGMLAVEAGASYEGGATHFCIKPEFETAGTSGSAYLFWNNVDRYLGWHISSRRGQTLDLTAERVVELVQPGAFEHAFRILQTGDRTELEDAIARAVYWYGDAHRDPVSVMQFVKYWSCLECLLGGAGKELTENLAVGVVILLTYGHFRLFFVADYDKNIKVVKRLYAARSKAVHRASHSHILFSDLSKLSTWTAWVIYNAVSLSHSGMPNTNVLWQRVKSVQAEENAAGVSSDA